LCGNGVIDCGEDCDDGNRRDGDGCPSNCKWARAWRRIRSDLSLKRDGIENSFGLDSKTEDYISGKISWEDYLFKRHIQDESRSVYSSLLVGSESNETTSGSGAYRGLTLKPTTTGTPLSSYLLFGKCPESPKQFSNPKMEKLASEVCEQYSFTKFAHAKAKLQLLTYVEAQMEGCRSRANKAWIAMTRMSDAAFRPPCKKSECCKVADMVSEKMICDGGTVAFPTCDATSCTWVYDCSNATLGDENDRNDYANTTVVVLKPKSVYYRSYGARATVDYAYELDTTASGLSDPAKVGIGVGSVILFVVIMIVVIILVMKFSKKKVETA